MVATYLWICVRWKLLNNLPLISNLPYQEPGLTSQSRDFPLSAAIWFLGRVPLLPHNIRDRLDPVCISRGFVPADSVDAREA